MTSNHNTWSHLSVFYCDFIVTCAALQQTRCTHSLAPIQFSKHHLVFRGNDAGVFIANNDDEYFCCRRHLPCAHLQELDNAAYASLLCAVHIIYRYSLLVYIYPSGKVNSVNWAVLKHSEAPTHVPVWNSHTWLIPFMTVLTDRLQEEENRWGQIRSPRR